MFKIKKAISVIPVNLDPVCFKRGTGIQFFRMITLPLDLGDDLMQLYHCLH